jgi:YcxB-like protein
LQLQFTYTAQDSVDAYKVHFRKRGSLLNRIFFRLSLPLGIVFILFLALLPVLTKTSKPSSVVVPTLIGMWWIYIGTLYISQVARRSYRSRPERQVEFSVVIDESGVRMTNAISSSEYKWACFTSSLETDKVILLYVSFCAFEYFPKRVFSPEQLRDLRELIAAQVKSQKFRTTFA